MFKGGIMGGCGPGWTEGANFVKVLGINNIKRRYFHPKKTKWRCDTCGKVYNIDMDAYICCSKVSVVDK